MSKVYTESELRALGVSQEQIESMDKDRNKSIKEAVEAVTNQNIEDKKVINFANELKEATAKPLQATSIAEIKRQAGGEFVELPGFIEGEHFIVKLRRPSLLAMVRQGRIPNTLLNEATELFSNGTSTVGRNNENSLKEMMDVIEIICEASLIQPTWKELKDNDIELTDEQLMAMFSYSQRGIKGVEQFRNI